MDWWNWADGFYRLQEDGGSRWSWMLQLVAVDVEWEDSLT